MITPNIGLMYHVHPSGYEITNNFHQTQAKVCIFYLQKYIFFDNYCYLCKKIIGLLINYNKKL